jgi:glycosyltransferase involved in cell wall biosynthesis
MVSSVKLVSVIIPCCNAERMLRAALLSIVEQTYPEIEIIFVDNNSSDRSGAIVEEIAASSGRSIQIIQCSDQGVNYARNCGYSLAKGDFIQWMDADDAIDPDKIARQVAALEENSSYDIAYGDWTAHRVRPNKPNSIERHSLSQIDDQLHRALSGIWYPNHLYLLRRSAAERLQDVRAWCPGRACGTDVEYSGFAALLGLRFLHVPGAHVTYNIWSAKQISNTSYRDRVAALEAIYLRLRQYAADQANITLTERHKTLLDQNWKIWRMPPRSAVLVKAGLQSYKLRHTAGGHEIDLELHEAALAKTFIALPVELASAHYALLLTMKNAAELGDDPVAAIEFLQRLQREGFLEAV